jgi:cell wall-associated NlpC family hydrolase
MITARVADPGAALAEAASGLIGCPFRLHGRNPETGLDCVGLVAAAITAAGGQPDAPSGYALRNIAIDHWLHFAAASGLIPTYGSIRAGDLLLIALPPCQHHLVIAESAASVIHAHAGLRQVVRQPLEPHWHIIARWHPIFS